MSETPRTDKSCGWPWGHHGRIESSDLKCSLDGPFVHSSVARELERENAALREKFMFAESEIILLREDREELREIAARMATEMRETDHEFASLRDYDAARKEAQP